MALSLEEVTPREPQQARGRETVKTLLRESERHLLEVGVAGFSMPTVAARAQVNRATAYGYFPTKYAIFNALAQRYTGEFLEQVRAWFRPDPATGWQEAVRALAGYTAELYSRRPVAGVLFLRGALTPEIETVHHETNNKRVARFMRQTIEASFAVPKLPQSPDPYLITIEAVIGVFSASQRTHGSITDVYLREAQRVAVQYLASCYAEARESSSTVERKNARPRRPRSKRK